MAFNELIAQQIRECITPFEENISEKKMFGGLSFLYKGKMSVGVVKDELVARVVSEKYENALKKPHTRPMDFNGKVMKDFVFVEEEGFKSNEQIMEWIELGVEHAERASGK